ncbi:50S ribosomal protein L29 [Candidatus Shapirobacteria bacterium CG_4_9_14_0_2_um_filter_39_11]|uniref:Large ribosomal subunit protein uL29 n=1 Tax=Candidatus Shapirobacteria bacterium CG_4_9_14_0_2_um_filter_39_11 TaxID=1974478 RepID=A0A2M8ETA1_9BACT|nr:MAG: 50S ribosomal protein L29 [Candidatus Shapirobacteria bacterium CG_4_9_14_0_2_um_filter_39_11]
MKKKELNELHTKSTDELKQLIKKTQLELIRSQMEQKAGKLKNVHLVKQKRHDLARLKTILKELELGVEL